MSDDPTRPDPEEQPRVTDKRRIDPETGELREPTPEEQVLAAAEEAAGAAAAEVVGEDLADAQRLAAERLDELQRRNADYYNLEQQYSAYVKRSKAEALAARDQGVVAVAEALISVLDDIELARQHGDLVGPFASIAEKLESTVGRFGIERYGAAGEPFDPQVHEALMHGHSADVTEPTVQQVLQPGYRMGERVVRAARVAVVDPEA
ncbi:nucleotide exchange factor GrpE [Cellulomonas triticagri]|uniref:Protein GrpE n=1 Tax=Cellulomonas triticagri TaxID=2483352 RepID=A0A3M2JHL6_9CELL|nr:nucleotide exchange factor GrpE [Cellulomonas triticagri]RMI13312.1 nucleotide exchange factor GrpE [Cellulomonas triticagri]